MWCAVEPGLSWLKLAEHWETKAASHGTASHRAVAASAAARATDGFMQIVQPLD